MTANAEADWLITKTVQINSTLSAFIAIGSYGMTTDWLGQEAPIIITEREYEIYRKALTDVGREVADFLGAEVFIISPSVVRASNLDSKDVH